MGWIFFPFSFGSNNANISLYDVKKKKSKTIIELRAVSEFSFILQLANKYFLFMEVLFTQHILVVILRCETGTLITIVDSLKSGLRDVDADIYSKVRDINHSLL